jgi:hypothetical protein
MLVEKHADASIHLIPTCQLLWFFSVFAKLKNHVMVYSISLKYTDNKRIQFFVYVEMIPSEYSSSQFFKNFY